MNRTVLYPLGSSTSASVKCYPCLQVPERIHFLFPRWGIIPVQVFKKRALVRQSKERTQICVDISEKSFGVSDIYSYVTNYPKICGLKQQPWTFSWLHGLTHRFFCSFSLGSLRELHWTGSWSGWGSSWPHPEHNVAVLDGDAWKAGSILCP